MLLDTGTNFSFVNQDLLEIQPLNIQQKPQMIPLSLLDGTFLGILPFYPLNLSAAGVDGMIGFDFFDKYAVCIDFPHQTIFFKKNLDP